MWIVKIIIKDSNIYKSLVKTDSGKMEKSANCCFICESAACSQKSEAKTCPEKPSKEGVPEDLEQMPKTT